MAPESHPPQQSLEPGETVLLTCTPARITHGSNLSERSPSYTLHVTNHRLLFDSTKPPESTKSFTLSYEKIILHAICDNTEHYPEPCVLLQTDDEDEEEMRIVPKDVEVVQRIFELMCEVMQKEQVADNNEKGWLEKFEGDLGAEDDGRFDDAVEEEEK